MIRPLQTKVFPSIGSQQAAALPMQSTTLPASTTSTSQIDIGELMNLMITMMIVVMMMKMMGGMMEGVGGSKP